MEFLYVLSEENSSVSKLLNTQISVILSWITTVDKVMCKLYSIGIFFIIFQGILFNVFPLPALSPYIDLILSSLIDFISPSFILNNFSIESICMSLELLTNILHNPVGIIQSYLQMHQ